MEVKEKVNNEAIKPADAKLEDLPITEEQAEETKGAGDAQTRLLFGTEHGLYVS